MDSHYKDKTVKRLHVYKGMAPRELFHYENDILPV